MMCAALLSNTDARPRDTRGRSRAQVQGSARGHRVRHWRSRVRQTVSPSVARERTVHAVPTPQETHMAESDTGERVTDVLNLPSRDGLVVNAVRVDYEPGGFSPVHRHPAGAYVYVIDGSVMFGVDHHAPAVLKAGDSFYEPPGALHTVSRNASQELPASLLVFFVLGEGESPTVAEVAEAA